MSTATPETASVTRGCLYRPQSERRNTLSKQVSFPEDDSRLVTGYMEAPNPWEYAANFDVDQLVSSYTESCLKHGHQPSSTVLKQLKALEFRGDRCSLLDLKGELLDSIHCESLEDILKRIQFVTLSLEDTSLDDEGSVAVFDMIEYYESANHLNISGNQNIAVRGWQACSRMIKKTQCLEQLEACNMTLNEQIMPILSRSLRITTHLQVLKLVNCKLSGRPIIILVGALKLNTGLRELYIADNDLGVTDALQLAALLRSNTYLQLLDLSNNCVQDDGAGHIIDGLIEQPISGSGLSILVLWNNRLTRNSSSHFARALSNCRSLEMLNIGHNVLSSDVLHSMKDSLQQNRTLLRLGMQSTHLTCEGAIVLAEVIEDNPVIQRIDLRDNAILVAGLMALALSMKSNKNVTQLDLDDSPKKRGPDISVKEYCQLVSEIRSYCANNEQNPPPDVEEDEEDVSEVSDSERLDRRVRLSSINSRKISLTCQTLLRSVAYDSCISNSLLVEPRRSGGRLRSPAPSPVPSPVSSPMPSPAPSPGPARNRFRVSQVSESDSLSPSPSASPSSSPTCFFPSSRFKVTVVEPPSPVIPSNSVTMGFSCSQDSNFSSDKDSVTPDTDNEVQNIMANANPDGMQVLYPSSGSQVAQQQSPQSSLQYCQQSASQQPLQQNQARSRKISWVQMGISSVTSNLSDENKTQTGLERLLGLFQNPGSLFNKTQSPQPPSTSHPTQGRSPQSSPQQQRAAQIAENGLGQNPRSSAPSASLQSVSCSNEHRSVSNGNSSSCRFRPLAVIGQSGDSISVEHNAQGGRDMLNNNEERNAAPNIDKSKSLAGDIALTQDENLNVHVSDHSGGSGGGDATAEPSEPSPSTSANVSSSTSNVETADPVFSTNSSNTMDNASNAIEPQEPDGQSSSSNVNSAKLDDTH